MNLEKRFKTEDYIDFSEYIVEISREIGFKVSARGWAYILEQKRLINKNEFDKVANVINICRKRGFLPIDFVAEEDARSFKGIERPTYGTVVQDSAAWLNGFLDSPDSYTPDWWDGEEYYIQMLVEKIDLVTLFEPICREYHIPIANSKGWSSMLQRAEYAKRFNMAERDGKKCVLLYCGDHDPDGLRISEFIRKNLRDLKEIVWSTGTEGYDPSELIIDRFGLNYEFIEQNNLIWIDNLITGSGKNLASLMHKNNKMPYVQEYLKNIGERKCEANAIVTMPESSKELVVEAIEKYLGEDALARFAIKRAEIEKEFQNFLQETGLRKSINNALDIIGGYEDE